MIVKICGITRLEDAQVCALEGADIIGFIFAPSPRRVEAPHVKDIIAELDGNIRTAGVFVNAPLDEVNRITDLCSLDYVQLSGDESDAYAGDVHAPVIRSIPVSDSASFDRVSQYTHYEILLYDTASAMRGGSGTPFDWSLLAGKKRPYLIAGGINPENVSKALAFKPDGIDVSSGVEVSPGIKSAEKIRALMKVVYGGA
ncbi:MAG: phosphoribosylanthranilate isomerase [Spirochaetes bacterium]|nr:phosphoribosylanthranilate isomerase [Spirochaetota bacterium]